MLEIRSIAKSIEKYMQEHEFERSSSISFGMEEDDDGELLYHFHSSSVSFSSSHKNGAFDAWFQENGFCYFLLCFDEIEKNRAVFTLINKFNSESNSWFKAFINDNNYLMLDYTCQLMREADAGEVVETIFAALGLLSDNEILQSLVELTE